MSARAVLLGATAVALLGALYLWISRGPAILLDMSWLNNCF